MSIADLAIAYGPSPGQYTTAYQQAIAAFNAAGRLSPLRQHGQP
jgi:hypothetical protein